MNALSSFNTTSTGDIIPTAAGSAALACFEYTLNTCISFFNRGKDTATFQGYLEERFGNMLLGYFHKTLTKEIGIPVSMTCLNDDGMQRTVVAFHKDQNLHINNEGQAIGHLHQQVATDQLPNITSAMVVKKKAPRPMNCWIIYRDAMHKQLKAENPHLTVQQISTRCSQLWRALSPAEKKPWQAAAMSAKEEHLRLHPDYKYSPRKPGEKKKRQSRKAKQAASMATSLQSCVPHKQGATITTFTVPPSHAVQQPLPDINIINTFNALVDQVVESGPIFNFDLAVPPMGVPNYDTESNHQQRLEHKIGAQIDFFDCSDLNGEFAFRAGADSNATLTSIYSDSF